MNDRIKPYAFEPECSNNNQRSEIERKPGENRRGNINWCTCGQCTIMSTESEKISEVKGGLDCITEHDSFYSVVLNIDTLQASHYQIMYETTKPEKYDK